MLLLLLGRDVRTFQDSNGTRSLSTKLPLGFAGFRVVHFVNNFMPVGS